MPLPLLPLVLVGAGAAALLYELLKPKAAPSGAPGGKGGPIPPGQPGSDLPSQLQSLYEQVLTQSTQPDAVEAVAVKLDAYGYNVDAAALRAREAQLRAVGPTPPVAPPPGVLPFVPPGVLPVTPPQPVQPVAPPPGPVAPTPGAQSLPIMTYEPDTRPVTDASAYYYDAQNGKHAKIDVRADSAALRFLGFGAPPDPGYSGDMGTDSSQGLGSWNPQLQAAVKAFQAANGDAVDGWLGPQTISTVSQAVAAKNGQNAAQNQANGVPDVAFAGLFDRMRTAGRRRKVRGVFSGVDGRLDSTGDVAVVSAPYGLRLRAQPVDGSRTLSFLPLGTAVSVAQTVAGPKRDATAPGSGGWAMVAYGSESGWVPSEWLVAHA